MQELKRISTLTGKGGRRDWAIYLFKLASKFRDFVPNGSKNVIRTAFKWVFPKNYKIRLAVGGKAPTLPSVIRTLKLYRFLQHQNLIYFLNKEILTLTSNPLSNCPGYKPAWMHVMHCMRQKNGHSFVAPILKMVPPSLPAKYMQVVLFSLYCLHSLTD